MRRALLIGCQLSDLLGVDEDLLRVDEALGLHGFTCRVIKGVDAIRDGILAAIREFIEDTAPGDAALLYYTGHGGRITRDLPVALDGGVADGPTQEVYQYIVPNDQTAEDFRGIFSVELSALLVELTMRTRNVTCVLDCCYATGTPAGTEFRARALPGYWTESMATRVDWLRAQGYDLGARAMFVESNPNAVRLVACAADELAYESFDGEVESGGLLTAAFVALLHEALDLPEPPAWDALGKRIRERVQAANRAQHPDVLGPIDRRLFTVEETVHTDVFAYVYEDGRPLLRGGEMHGIRVGDRFLVMPLNAGVPDRGVALAELEADEVYPQVTFVKFAPFAGRLAAQGGARAFRVATSHQRQAVALAVESEEGLGARLSAAIGASPRLALAGPSDQVFATLTAVAGGLELRDEQRVLVRRVVAADTLELRPVVRRLFRLSSGKLAVHAPMA